MLYIKKFHFNFCTKRLFVSKDFSFFYGIGENRITQFNKQFGLNKRIKLHKINFITHFKINKLISKITYKNSLKKELLKLRKFTIEKLKNYKGVRHMLRYPVRGQRTHTNAKTRKKLKMGLNSYYN